MHGAQQGTAWTDRPPFTVYASIHKALNEFFRIPMPALRFTSAAFSSQESIPREYTCEGADVSPPLEWNAVPDGTESLVLIVDDPDAPGQTFTHWVLFNVPSTETSLPRDLQVDAQFGGADPAPREGKNDFGDVGYGGPCPPPGDGEHRYFFRLFAVDRTLDLDAGVSKAEVLSAIEDHVLDQAEVVGTYER